MSRKTWLDVSRKLKVMSKRKTAQAPNRWRIVAGDMVHVSEGRDDGVQGKVMRINRDNGKVFVEGVGLRRRYAPAQGDQPAGYFQSETPVHISQLALLDPVDNTPTKIRWEKCKETGTKLRISKKSGKEIEKPFWENQSVPDRGLYEEQAWDTTAAVLAKETYVPTPFSFEEEVLQALLKDIDVNAEADEGAADASAGGN